MKKKETVLYKKSHSHGIAIKMKSAAGYNFIMCSWKELLKKTVAVSKPCYITVESCVCLVMQQLSEY